MSVPPYHIAGVANAVSNVYAARRIVYLPAFTPESWLDTVQGEGITHAMVVPTMLARVVEHLGDDAGRLRHAALARLRRRSDAGDRARAGAGRVPRHRLRQRLRPHRDQLDDRGARARRPPRRDVRRRGRPAARLVVGRPARAGHRGRGPRRARSGCGASRCRASTSAWPPPLDGDGWFPTRDRGWVDDEGYLFIEGRSDDTIIRGGENIAPGRDRGRAARRTRPWCRPPSWACPTRSGASGWRPRWCCARGRRSTRTSCGRSAKERLRSSKTPDLIAFRDELPAHRHRQAPAPSRARRPPGAPRS